jgi:hypothetical protein
MKPPPTIIFFLPASNLVQYVFTQPNLPPGLIPVTKGWSLMISVDIVYFRLPISNCQFAPWLSWSDTHAARLVTPSTPKTQIGIWQSTIGNA